MNIIDMWIGDATLVIELHDDITVKETVPNYAFGLSESFVLHSTFFGQSKVLRYGF